MEDFSYLFQDSAHAWLRGRGDSRFPTYERQYRAAQEAAGESFKLEDFNEIDKCPNQFRARPIARFLARPAFAKFAIACFIIWCSGRLVPVLVQRDPEGAAFLLVVAFVMLRIFHRRPKKEDHRRLCNTVLAKRERDDLP